MTSSHVLLVVVVVAVLTSVVAMEESTSWDPVDCPIWKCDCRLDKKLKSICCTNQDLFKTPVNGFAFPEGTQLADLSNNNFTVLPEEAFSRGFHASGGLPTKLLELNLSRNQIERISEDAFTHLDGLVKLDISYNKIGLLYPKTFRNMTKLEELYLQHNLIRTLEEFLFKGLDSLKILDLSNCNITQISWWAFYFAGNPTLLNLENNGLTTFHYNYVYSPPGFTGEINLRNNPINCDCALEPFFGDFDHSRRRYHLTCSEPSELRGFQISALMRSDFRNCTSGMILSPSNRTVEAFVSSKTTLSCQTIPGPLYKNWTIAYKDDHIGEPDRSDRYVESTSATWMNLTITATRMSDAGEYTCFVAERKTGWRRTVAQNITLIVRENDNKRVAVNNCFNFRRRCT